jgi:hypothetical protein
LRFRAPLQPGCSAVVVAGGRLILQWLFDADEVPGDDACSCDGSWHSAAVHDRCAIVRHNMHRTSVQLISEATVSDRLDAIWSHAADALQGTQRRHDNKAPHICTPGNSNHTGASTSVSIRYPHRIQASCLCWLQWTPFVAYYDGFRTVRQVTVASRRVAWHINRTAQTEMLRSKTSPSCVDPFSFASLPENHACCRYATL